MCGEILIGIVLNDGSHKGPNFNDFKSFLSFDVTRNHFFSLPSLSFLVHSLIIHNRIGLGSLFFLSYFWYEGMSQRRGSTSMMCAVKWRKTLKRKRRHREGEKNRWIEEVERKNNKRKHSRHFFMISLMFREKKSFSQFCRS